MLNLKITCLYVLISKHNLKIRSQRSHFVRSGCSVSAGCQSNKNHPYSSDSYTDTDLKEKPKTGGSWSEDLGQTRRHGEDNGKGPVGEKLSFLHLALVRIGVLSWPLPAEPFWPYQTEVYFESLMINKQFNGRPVLGFIYFWHNPPWQQFNDVVSMNVSLKVFKYDLYPCVRSGFMVSWLAIQYQQHTLRSVRDRLLMVSSIQYVFRYKHFLHNSHTSIRHLRQAACKHLKKRQTNREPERTERKNCVSFCLKLDFYILRLSRGEKHYRSIQMKKKSKR